MKKRLKIISLLICLLLLLTSCAKDYPSFGVNREGYNEDFKIVEIPLTGGNVSDDFMVTIEAEDGIMSGSATVRSGSEYSGGRYVTGVNRDGDSLTFVVEIDNEGMYDLNFRAYSDSVNRGNNASVNGVNVGFVSNTVPNEVSDGMIPNVYLSKGTNEITITPNWGWVSYDSLIITKSTLISEKTYDVKCELANPNADENTKRLYKFLCEIYGNYTLTGQYADRSRESDEFREIKLATGDYPAVLGLDMMDYSITNKQNGAQGKAIEYALDWYHNMGGIVQFCWHWNSDVSYVKNDSESHWWNSFYSSHTNLDLDKIMNGEDEEGYNRLMEDIDNISDELKRLRDEGVPILWRPLHETSGGWFWWGDCEPESFIKLWQIMFDKMTYEHELTNIIWMWNGQNKDWYPGDDYVDIVSWDVYAGEHEYGSQSGTFAKCAECYGETKLIALSENGCIPDPDLMYRDNARWLLWGVWNGEYAVDDFGLNSKYTEKYMVEKAYSSEYTLTLSELPNLKKYPLE